MYQYVSLLRGINVSGKNKIKMAELRDLYAYMGFTTVASYIQSGNVVFESKNEDGKVVAQHIHNGILEKFNFDVPVQVRTKAEMDFVLGNNPFAEEELKTLYVTFLDGVVDEQLGMEVLGEALGKTADTLKIIDNIIYLHVPTGYGRTKLNNNFLEKKLGVSATTRNWKTVKKLHEMLQA